MARYKTRRQARYETLINRYHFLPAEAAELSKIKKHTPPGGGVRQYPPAMLAIQRSRLAMWANYKQWVGKEAWLELSVAELKSVWGGRVRKFYERHRIIRDKLTNWVVHKDVHGKRIKPSPSVWDYYDSMFQKLPDEQKWDTPRSHRTGHPGVAVLKVSRRYEVKKIKSDIAFFKKRIKETGDPKDEWGWRLRDAEYRLKQGDY